MPPILFDWDHENIRHLARHQITPEQVEQVIRNRPIDLGLNLRNGEERTTQVGETDAALALVVISTMRVEKIRVVTAWPAKERLRRLFLSLKRNGNVGRIEEQDLCK
jgi:uncharacterized DUF497 family protein